MYFTRKDLRNLFAIFVANPMSKHWCLWFIMIRNNDKDTFLIRTWSKNLSVMETWVLPVEEFPSIFIPSSNFDHSKLPTYESNENWLLYWGGEKTFLRFPFPFSQADLYLYCARFFKRNINRGWQFTYIMNVYYTNT